MFIQILFSQFHALNFLYLPFTKMSNPPAKVINLADRRAKKEDDARNAPISGWITWLYCPKCKSLEYSEEENVSLKKSKKKYDEAQIKIIMRFRDIPNITMARACRLLEKNENIKISSQTLKKVWNGDY